MSNFKLFRNAVKTQFNNMANASNLFVVQLDKDKLWDVYLNSFPEGFNEIFRVRREYDCSCCKSFFRNIGNVVAIGDGDVTSVFDLDNHDLGEFNQVAKELSKFVKEHHIASVFVHYTDTAGTDFNMETLEDGRTIKWEHIKVDIPNKYVIKNTLNRNAKISNKNSTVTAFKGSLDKITLDSLETVIELAKENELYKVNEYLRQLEAFKTPLEMYSKLKTEKEKNLFAWQAFDSIGESVAKIKNTSIGTLLLDLSEGVDFDTAVRSYLKVVDPVNFKHSKPVYSKRMKENALKAIVDGGYRDSLNRRFAVMSDITANNVLYKDSRVQVNKKNTLEDMLSLNEKKSTDKYDKATEISISNLLKELETSDSLELYLESRLENNLVSMIAPQDKESKSLFKWDNGFSWSYNGNITDAIKRNVEKAGGSITGDMRFSLQWNDGATHNSDDLDLHCVEYNGNIISFRREVSPYTKGELDVDIIVPERDKPAVENITWEHRTDIKKGVYRLEVECFSDRGGKDGFKAQVEVLGETYNFEYNLPLRHKQIVEVAEVTYDGVEFKVKPLLPLLSSTSKDIWGLKTNQFVPVSVVMNSPNFWDEENKQGTGNKHFFFMLKGCTNPNTPNGFYNEFLTQDLYAHRNVLEFLGSQFSVESTEEQLSGVGFSVSQRNHAIVKVKKDNKERVYKVLI